MVNKEPYLVADWDIWFDDECLFVINTGDKKDKYVIGSPYNLFVDQVKATYRVVGRPENIGLKYVSEKLGTYGRKRSYTTELTKAEIKQLAKDVDCEVMAVEICTNYGGEHIKKDCNCKSGFANIIETKDNKIVFKL